MTDSELKVYQTLYGHSNLANLPKMPGLPGYGEDDPSDIENVLGVLAQLPIGVIEGLTTLNLGSDPDNTAEAIARRIGSLGGFIAPFGIPGMVGAKVAATVAPKIMRGVVGLATAAKIKPIWAVKLGANMLGEAAKLGAMSAVSNWQGGVDAMLHGAVGGVETGAAFQVLSYIPDVLGLGKAKGIARILATSLYSGLPSTLRKDTAPEQVYEYLLGGYFGWKGRANAFSKTKNIRGLAFDVEATYSNMTEKTKVGLKDAFTELYKRYEDLDMTPKPETANALLHDIGQLVFKNVPSEGSLWENKKSGIMHRIDGYSEDAGKFIVTPVERAPDGNRFLPAGPQTSLTRSELGSKVLSISQLKQYTEQPPKASTRTQVEDAIIYRESPTKNLLKGLPEISLQYTGKEHIAGRMYELADLIDRYTGTDFNKTSKIVNGIFSAIGDKEIKSGRQFTKRLQPILGDVLEQAQKDGFAVTSPDAYLMGIWHAQKNTKQYGQPGQYYRGTLDLTGKNPKFLPKKKGPYTKENQEDYPGFLADRLDNVTNQVLKVDDIVFPKYRKVNNKWVTESVVKSLGRLNTKDKVKLQEMLAAKGLTFWVNRAGENDFNVVKLISGNELKDWAWKLRDDMYDAGVPKKEVNSFFTANKARLAEFATVHKYNTLAAGPGYLKEFNNPIDFIKRVQGMEAKGVSPDTETMLELGNSKSGNSYELDDNGIPKIKFAIIQDTAKQKTKKTRYSQLAGEEWDDGKLILEDKHYERTAIAAGEDPAKSQFKGFVLVQRPEGTVMMKVAMFKASGEGHSYQDFLVKHGLHEMVYSSGAKMKGGITPFELTDGITGTYDLKSSTSYHAPNDMRIQYQSPHFILNPYNGQYQDPMNFVYQRMPGFAGRKGQAALNVIYKQNAIEINKKLQEVMSDPKKMQKWLREEVFKQGEDEMDPLDYEAREYIESSKSTAERIAKTFAYDPVITQLPGGGQYVEAAIKNWVVRSILKPKVGAYDFVLGGITEDIFREHEAVLVGKDGKLRDDVMILGNDARYIRIKNPNDIYLINKNGNRVRNTVTSSIINGLGKKAEDRTIGALFDKISKTGKYDIRMVIARSPIENRSGVLAVTVGGFGSEESGNKVFMSHGMMKRLGGADNDIDKIRAWWTLPKNYVDEVAGNINYLAEENRQLDSFLKERVDNEYKADTILGKAHARDREQTISQQSLPKYSGGYENTGKGTPAGDGKDKAMRAVADTFIGEITKQNSSSATSKKEIDSKGIQQPKVVMLARNSELKGRALRANTKEKIFKMHKLGARFVVGDMPGVDSQFIDYLQNIGADFTIYHTGTKPRIQLASEPAAPQQGPAHPKIQMVDPDALLSQGMRNAAAKDAIGKVFSLDRAFTELISKKMVDIPDDVYDRIMMYYKRRSVDSAKYGGTPPWSEMKKEILGHLAEAEKNPKKYSDPKNPFGWVREFPTETFGEGVLKELDLYADMFRHVYSRDIANNRPWTWQQMVDNINYFNTHKTDTGHQSLYEFMTTSVGETPVMRGILDHINIDSFSSHKAYFNANNAGYKVPEGGDFYAKRLKELGITNWGKFMESIKGGSKVAQALYEDMVMDGGKLNDTKFFKLVKTLGLKFDGDKEREPIKGDAAQHKHVLKLLKNQQWLREKIGKIYFDRANQFIVNDIYAMAAHDAEGKHNEFVIVTDARKKIAENAATEIFKLRKSLRGKNKVDADKIQEQIADINENIHKRFKNDPDARKYFEYRIISGRPEPSKKGIQSQHDIVSTMGYQDFNIVRESIVNEVSMEFLNRINAMREGIIKPVRSKKGSEKKYYEVIEGRGSVTITPNTPEQEKLYQNLQNNPEFSKHFVQFATGKLGKNILDPEAVFTENDVKTLNNVIKRITEGSFATRMLKKIGIDTDQFRDLYNTILPEALDDFLIKYKGWRVWDPEMMKRLNGEPVGVIKYLQDRINHVNGRIQYKANSINNYHIHQMEQIFGNMSDIERKQVSDIAIAKWESGNRDNPIYHKVWVDKYQKIYDELPQKVRDNVDNAELYIRNMDNLTSGKVRNKVPDVKVAVRVGDELQWINIKKALSDKLTMNNQELKKIIYDIMDDRVTVNNVTKGRVRLIDYHFPHKWNSREEYVQHLHDAFMRQIEAEPDPVKKEKKLGSLDANIAKKVADYDAPHVIFPGFKEIDEQHRRHYAKDVFVGNLRRRSLHVLGYRRDLEVLPEFFNELARKQYLEEYTGVADKILKNFSNNRELKDKLGEENYAKWKKYLVGYIQDTLNYPVKERKIFGMDLGDEAFMRHWNSAIDKTFGDNSNYKFRDPQDTHHVSRLEGIYELASLLFTPKALVQNVFGGTLNNVIYGGLKPVWDANKISKEVARGTSMSGNLKNYLNKKYGIPIPISDKFNSPDRLNYMLQKSGVITEMISNELALNSLEKMTPGEVFSKANKDIRNAIAKKISNAWAKNLQGKEVDKVKFRKELMTILKDNNMLDSISQVSGIFMKEGEWFLRKQSFLTGYLYAWKNNLVYGKDERRHEQAMEWGKKFVNNTQYLYSPANRPALSNSALGQIMYRFKQWSVKQVQFQNQIIRAAKERGFEKDTPEYGRFERMMLADAMLVGLGNVFMFSIFDNSLPSPLNEIQDFSKLVFGNDEERDEAFFGTYGTSIVTPPIARLPVQALLSMMRDDWHMFANYHAWAAMPFGRMMRDVKKLTDKPSWAMETLTGIPIHQTEKLNKEDKEFVGPVGPISGMFGNTDTESQ